MANDGPLRELLAVLETARTADLDLLEVETGDFALAWHRAGGPVAAVAQDTVRSAGPPEQAPPEQPPPEQPPVEQPPPAAAAGSDAPSAAPDTPEGRVTVPAPMVGVFYRRPEPGAAPFVEVGGTVSAGDTMALVEVMKLFNALTSPVEGSVESVLAEDGELVEYGQPLFVVHVAE